MITAYFDEMEIGDKSVTRGRTITETDVVNFAMFSGDWYPLHTDAEYAKNNHLYGERIAHGMLVLSVCTGLTPWAPGTALAFYGMDRVRFVSPTKIGDTVHVETEVVDKTLHDDASGVVTVSLAVKNQRGQDAIVATAKTLVARKQL